MRGSWSSCAIRYHIAPPRPAPPRGAGESEDAERNPAMETSKTRLKALARQGGKEAVEAIKALKDESARLRAMKRLPPKDKLHFLEDDSAPIQSEAKWAKRFLPAELLKAIEPQPPKAAKPAKAPKGKGEEKGKGKEKEKPEPKPETPPAAE